MKTTRFTLIILILLAFLSGCKTTQIVQSDPVVKDTIPTPTSELRGYVMLPESWINDDADIMKKNISTIIRKVAEANYNALFFYAREGAETYYPSPFEPWSEKLDYQTPGFDPLEVAIEETHQNNLRIYAGIDLLKIGYDNDPPDFSDHLYFKYGPGLSADSTWLILNDEGNPLNIDGSFYLNPSLPQVKSYLKSITRNLIENYNLDGLSFDLADYPTGAFSYDSFARQKFLQDSLQFFFTKREWVENRLKDLIEDIVVEVMLVKPYLINSIVFSYKNESEGFIRSLEEGIIDFIIPKIGTATNTPGQQVKDIWDEIHGEELNGDVFPMFTMYQKFESEEELNRVVNFNTDNGGRGIVLIPENSESGIAIPDSLYYKFGDKMRFPDSLKKVTPRQVVGFDVSGLFTDDYSGQTILLSQNKKLKVTDSEGYVGFITSDPDTIEFGTSNGMVILPTERWAIPFKYAVNPDNRVERIPPWVEFRRMPQKYGDIPDYDLLCKTQYPATAWINDDPVKIYKTGVFFNKISLNEGANRVRAGVLTPDSLSAFY